MKSFNKYHILAFLVSGLWGATFISTKVLINNGLSPMYIFCLRFLVAYIGIWCYSLCRGEKSSQKVVSLNIKDEFAFIFTGVTGGSLYFYAENTALSYTQASNVSFIVSCAPLLTTLLTLFLKSNFRGEYINEMEDIKGRWTIAAGTVLSMSGVFAVVYDGHEFSLSSIGDILALAAALCWCFYSVIMGRLTNRYGTIFATRKVFFYGLITGIPFLSLEQNPSLLVLQTPEVIWNLMFLSIIASLACFVLWNSAITHIGNVTATNYVYLNPFFTLAIAVAVLSETLTLQSSIGAIMIVGGVIIAGVKSSNAKVYLEQSKD